jgi:ribonuclease HI
MHNFVLMSDGGSRGNPGPAATGYVIYPNYQKIFYPEEIEKLTQNIPPVIQGGQYLGETTNNQAEWKALIQGLQEIEKNYGYDCEVQAFLDSELVVRQISGQYKVKNLDLKPLHEQLKELAKKFKFVSFSHVLRQYNKQADKMVNQILDERK